MSSIFRSLCISFCFLMFYQRCGDTGISFNMRNPLFWRDFFVIHNLDVVIIVKIIWLSQNSIGVVVVSISLIVKRMVSSFIKTLRVQVGLTKVIRKIIQLIERWSQCILIRSSLGSKVKVLFLHDELATTTFLIISILHEACLCGS